MNFAGDNSQSRVHFEVSIDGRRGCLALDGALSMRTTDEVSRALLALRHRGVTELELDLHGLTRLDSAGVALLLRLQHRASEEGWTVTIIAPPEHLRHQIARLGLAERLRFALI